MKAIILAGGNGSRLKRYGYERTRVPKPMLEIGGKPLISLIVEQLAYHGFDDIVISTGFMANKIEEYFKDENNFPTGVAISFSYQTELLGTAGPISIIPELDEPFLVINGDMLTDIDFSGMMKFHKSSGGIMTLATFKQEFDIRGEIVTREDNVIRYKEEKMIQDGSASVWICDPRIFKYMRRGEFLNLDDLINSLIGRERVMAFKTQNVVFDIGLDRDYEEANEYFEKNRGKFLEGEGKYKILFVCKFNRYRSNVALALFNKHNRNPNVIAKASGVVQGPPVLEKMKRVASEFGVSLERKPKHLTEYDYSWADLVITIGKDLDKGTFERIAGRPRKVISWELADVEQFDLDYYGQTMKLTAEIEARVKNLLKDLEETGLKIVEDISGQDRVEQVDYR